jgi:transcriptional regulator with XRE-family HTH domain
MDRNVTHQSDPKAIGQKLATYLKDLRQRRSLTQYDVCTRTGIAHTTYRRYERNDDDCNAGIAFDSLCALATLEGISVSDLVRKLEGDSSQAAKDVPWQKSLVEAFEEVATEDRDELFEALRTFSTDKIIPSPVSWLVRIGTVLLRSDRRFQLRIERDVLDQGINSDLFSDEKNRDLVRRIEQIIRELFRKKQA